MSTLEGNRIFEKGHGIVKTSDFGDWAIAEWEKMIGWVALVKLNRERSDFELRTRVFKDLQSFRFLVLFILHDLLSFRLIANNWIGLSSHFKWLLDTLLHFHLFYLNFLSSAWFLPFLLPPSIFIPLCF